MAFEVVWHPLASIDLEGEIDYVFYEFGWDASKRLYNEVMERINHLSQFPKLGVRCDGVTWNNHREPSYLEILIDSR